MRIFNLVIMNQRNYNREIGSYIAKVDEVENNHRNYEDILVGDKKKLEKRIMELDTEIHSLKCSNGAYKSNNARLKNENIKLKEELSHCYKLKTLPSDKTRYKQESKVKSSSKTSKIVKMMNS